MRKQDFPKNVDLPNLDYATASRALEALRQLVASDEVDVYSAHHVEGSRYPITWNVWIKATRQRVELQAWAASWLTATVFTEGQPA